VVGETCCLPSSVRHSETSARAVPPHLAVRCSSAIIAPIKRSHTDPAAIAIVQSATAGRATSGFEIERRRFCRFRTVTWSSRSLTNWRLWHFKTRASFTESCFVPWPNPFWKWLPIQNVSAPGLVFSPFYTRGHNDWRSTRISIVSCPPEDCLPMGKGGSDLARRNFSCR